MEAHAGGFSLGLGLLKNPDINIIDRLWLYLCPPMPENNVHLLLFMALQRLNRIPVKMWDRHDGCLLSASISTVNQNLKWLNPMQCRCLIWLWWLCILGCVLKSLFDPVQLSSKLDIVATSSKVAAVALQAAPQSIPKILLSKHKISRHQKSKPFWMNLITWLFPCTFPFSSLMTND